MKNTWKYAKHHQKTSQTKGAKRLYKEQWIQKSNLLKIITKLKNNITTPTRQSKHSLVDKAPITITKVNGLIPTKHLLNLKKDFTNEKSISSTKGGKHSSA